MIEIEKSAAMSESNVMNASKRIAVSTATYQEYHSALKGDIKILHCKR